MPVGGLRITDLGYHSLTHFARIAAQGAWFLSRFHHQTAVFAPTGERVVLWAWLATQPARVIDQSVLLGVTHRLAVRLLAVRAPRAIAAERRRTLHAAAQREGETVSDARLAATDWTVYITNVPAGRLNFDEADALYRARWQIELVFKVWKSHGALAVSTSHAPWRVLCEVYAKLLAMLVQHWLTLIRWGPEPGGSLWQAATTIQLFAWTLAAVCRHPAALRTTITLRAAVLAALRPSNRRRANPPTWLRLTCPPPIALGQRLS